MESSMEQSSPVEAIFGGIVALSLVFRAYENKCGNRGVGAIFVFITIAKYSMERE